MSDRVVVWSNTNLGVEAAAVRRSEIWVRRAAEETWLHLSVDDAHVRSFRMPNVYADRLAALLGGDGEVSKVEISKAEDKRIAECSNRVVSYLKAAKKLLTGSSVGAWGAEGVEIAKMIQQEVHRAERKS